MKSIAIGGRGYEGLITDTHLVIKESAGISDTSQMDMLFILTIPLEQYVA